MRVVHLGLWKVKQEAIADGIEAVQEEVRSYRDRIEGVLESHCEPVETFRLPGDLAQAVGGQTAGFGRGYNYVLYMVFDSPESRHAYDSERIHVAIAKPVLEVNEAGLDSIYMVDFEIP